MKSILVFYPQLDKPLSGGQVIDFEFINQIRTSGLFSMSFFQDSDLKSSSIFSYNFYLLLHVRQFLKYDVIFMNSRPYPRMFLFVLLLRILFFRGKLITYHHHYNYLIHKGFKRIVHKTFELSFLKLMNNVIVPSPYTFQLTRSFINDSKIKYIEIGFDNDIKENKCTNPYKWLFVGTVESRKGVDNLIKIADILRDKRINIEFDIVGSLSDTIYVDKMKNEIRLYGLEKHISLLGRIDDESLKHEYETSYGFIFPSLHEGYGMVLIEAMRYGLPVIAFDNSAMPYTIKNFYNGILVEDKNFIKMGDMICKLIEDKETYNKMQMNAYDTVRKIKTHSHMIEDMKKYIEEL